MVGCDRYRRDAITRSFWGHTCPDLGHSFLHCVGVCPSGPSLTEREQRKQRGFTWELRTTENLWEVAQYSETTVGTCEENPRRQKGATVCLELLTG